MENHLNDEYLKSINLAKFQNGASLISNMERSKFYHKNTCKGNYDQRCQPHFCIFQDCKNNINEGEHLCRLIVEVLKDI